MKLEPEPDVIQYCLKLSGIYGKVGLITTQITRKDELSVQDGGCCGAIKWWYPLTKEEQWWRSYTRHTLEFAV